MKKKVEDGGLGAKGKGEGQRKGERTKGVMDEGG